MTYAGSGQAERTAVGATVQRNGILGVQAETTAGATTIYERDNQGTLISEHTSSGDFYFALDSVTALVDATGVQRAAYTYDPYGAQATATPLNGTLPPNPWRYAGGYLDPTGLYHLGARYYEPATGRWTQQDSIVSLGNPADGNRYRYAGNDPANNLDLSGRSFLSKARCVARQFFPDKDFNLGAPTLVGLGGSIGAIATEEGGSTAAAAIASGAAGIAAAAPLVVAGVGIVGLGVYVASKRCK